MDGPAVANAARVAIAIPLLAAMLANPAWPADPLIDNKGFSPNRELVSQLPFEHIDPLTGNLLLTFTDLELPGNAGFNLRIERTYNSKIYETYSNLGGYSLAEDSWAGLGWTLHFGRVLQPNAISPGPIIEMPDGSRHQTFPHKDGVLAALSGHYITREHWTYERVSPSQGRLRLPNGITYAFDSARSEFLYATEISDAFGNKIVINYPVLAFFTRFDWINSVELRLTTGEVRKVNFAWKEQLPYADNPVDLRPAGSLATMTYQPLTKPLRTWTYVQTLKQPHNGMTLLNEVRPPIGPTWKFEYDETGIFVADNPAPYGMKAVNTPNGGRIEYAFEPQLFKYGSNSIYSPVIRTRTVSGPGLEPGTWHYEFDSPGFFDPVTVLVTSPCGKTRYTTRAIGPYADEKPWAIGALAKKETLDLDSNVLETEVFEWTASEPISDLPESGNSLATHVPLLSERTLTRGGKTYVTTYSYDDAPYNRNRANNFNDFGRAREIVENGESGTLTRKTSRTFFYGSSTDPSFGTYIVDKLAAEAVRVPEEASEAFTRMYEYDRAGGYRGFLKSQTIRGITTNFASETFAGQPTGNVKTAEDGNHHVTTYSYSFGVLREIKTPLHTLSRVVNDDGTLASETQRGFTTQFQYDALGRPTRTSPALGNPTLTEYDNLDGRSVRVTRGPMTVTTTLDGLGRAIATANNLGDPIRTRVDYNACGQRTFESYPVTGAPDGIKGARYAYDALARVREKSERGDGGDEVVRWDYGPGLNVRISDEKGNETSQTWAAFGDPGEARLLSVEDATHEVTSYTYNPLGSLRTVTPPAGPGRSWIYYSGEAAGKPGLLKTETHPENGPVTYTYDDAGNVRTRQDAHGTTSFTYDANNRLTQTARPDGSVVSLAYDASDNRTLLQHLYPDGVTVKATFSYDAVNRLVQRKDEFKLEPLRPQTFMTSYNYDANDRLDTLTYPSSTPSVPRKTHYAYDAAGRITSVNNPGKRTYADTFHYHPTGAIASFRPGNGRTQSFGLTRRNQLKSIAADVLLLSYAYEPNGNVRSINDGRSGFSESLTYDSLDRLVSVDSSEGAFKGTFSYDPLGNRLASTVGGAATFAYDAATQRLAGVNRSGTLETFQYDASGNTVQRQVGGASPQTFTYSVDNMMVAASMSGVSTSYRYDGDGQRVSKEQAGVLRYFVHGPGGKLLSEISECPTGVEATRDYVYAGDRLLAFVKPPLPTVRLTSTAATTTEQPGASVTFTVRLTTASGCPTREPVSVNYRTNDGTAHAGSDYAATSGTLTFPAGNASGTTQTVTIPLVNDTLVEPLEALTLSLAAPNGAVLAAPFMATVSILDNDMPRLAWVTPTATVLESAGQVTLAARIETTEGNALNASASVGYSTVNGTAIASRDYASQAGTLTFAAGTPSGGQLTVTIGLLPDTLVEKDETFKVTLSGATGAVLGTPSTAVVTLKDNSPLLSFGAAAFEVAEGGGTIALGVVLTTPDGQPTLVPTTVKCSAANLTAVANLDYAPAMSTLTFPAGTLTGATQTASVPIHDDALSEDDETFKVAISAPQGGKLGTQATAVVKILDNDPLPVLSIGDASISEPNAGAGSMVFSLQLSAAAGRVVSVEFATQSGSALEGLDFVKKAGTVKFVAGATKAKLAVSIKGDTLDEDNEAFLVSLDHPVGMALGQAQAQGTILDNDGRPALCQPIAYVPYTISSSGNYCLAHDLFWAEPTGQAISIEVNFVRLDLRGFRLDGTEGGSATQAVGIYANERTGLVIRHGRILGFQRGVNLRAAVPYTTSGLHLLEDLESQGNSRIGLSVAGRNNTVRRCTVTQTGTAGDDGDETFGIASFGPGLRLINNDVHEVTGLDPATGAVLVEGAIGAVVLGNRLSNDGTGIGLLIRSSQDVLVLRNHFIGFLQGLLFENPSTGTYRGNFTVGVSQPYTGGNDSGNNQ